MAFPGPDLLGRGAVIAPGSPQPFDDGEVIAVGAAELADAQRLGRIVERLYRAWVARRRVTVELGVHQNELRRPETELRPLWELGPAFTLLRDRLHHLVWANNWDLRGQAPVWWWAHKAAALGANVGGRADLVRPDGREVWVDGGPREPLDIAVVHADSVESGRLAVAAPPSSVTDDDLAPDQQAAVLHRRGPARIIAPAGSGKTRTLNARLVHLVDRRRIEPWLVTAVAYNNRAAAEMRARLGRDELHIRTIHSLGWRILRQARPGVVLLDDRAVRARLHPLIPARPRPDTDIIGPYIEAMSDIRIALRDPEQVEEERDDVPDLGGVFDRYREALDVRNEADHDEQIYAAIEQMLAQPDLRKEWQRRCRYMLVDEFQDLTPAYLLLIRLLASPGLQVFGVGDDDQTIYGYSGADPDFLVGFDQFFPGAAEHALEVNYRSPEQVVKAASLLLGVNRRRVSKVIRADARTDPEGLRTIESPGSRLTSDTVEVILGWLAAGVSARDIAVLARVNSALLPVLAALSESDVPVRSRVAGGLLNRTVMQAALAWLRLAGEPDAMWRQDLLLAARRPSRRINRLSARLLGANRPHTLDDLVRLGRFLDERQARAWSGWVDDLTRMAEIGREGRSEPVLDTLIEVVGLAGAAGLLDRGRTRVDRAAHSDDLVALRRTANVYQDLATFEERIRALLNSHVAESDRPGAGVTLSTVHRVKGLEWDRVVVFGVDEGLMPHDLAGDIEEERRVLHVAITRGRSKVVVVADSARPSRFLAELRGEKPQKKESREGTFHEPAARAARTSAKAETSEAPVPVDEELLARLKAWRLEVAKERAVPAFVVFWDRTLEEIARTLPRTEGELLEVQGIGPSKLDDYGEEVLELVRAATGPARTGDRRARPA